MKSDIYLTGAMSLWEVRTQRAGLELEARARRRVEAELRRPQEVELLSVDDAHVVAWRGEFELTGEPVTDHGILRRFAQLEEALPARYLAFARRYGPLLLCERHGLPVTHSWMDVADGSVKPFSGMPCFVAQGRGTSRFVYVEAWRRIAAQARAALSIGAELHMDRCGAASDWDILQEARRNAIDAEPGLDFLGDVTAERSALSGIVDQWIQLAGLRPTFDWSTVVQIQLVATESPAVYASIIRHLVHALGRVKGLSVCSGCGEPYVPARRRKYCADCGRTAANRDAQRRRREKLRAV